MKPPVRAPRITAATPRDAAAIRTLLRSAGLPDEDFADHLAHFLVARRHGAVVGAVGFERHGRAALLRSLVVAPAMRGSGLGAALTERIAADAAAAGVRMLYLLTTTAPTYFPRLGFEVIERAALPAELAGSEELKGACPASAVAMQRPLAGRWRV